jgi:trimethylamine--corrinoid protein Co-methyltransferase
MPNPKISLLSSEDRRRIHEQSLDILQKVGIQFRSQQALKIMAQTGCEVDWQQGSAKIPPQVVEKALETLPSQFLLAARDAGNDIHCGDGKLYFTAAAVSPYFRDLETRKRRLATSEDLIQCAHVIQTLDLVHEWASMVVPRDIHPELAQLHNIRLSLNETTKHFLGGISEQTFPFAMQMFDAVLGDREELKRRPLMSAVINPVSPLQNNGKLVDETLLWAPYRLPIFLQFLPLAGGTSPVTLAGTVLQANAEFLGNVALYQMAQPGWPILWAASAGTLDMTSGRWGMGAEGALMTLALIEMAKFYHVPVNAMGASACDAKAIGFQSGMEVMQSAMIPALGGADNMWGPADFDGATLVDLPFIVLAAEAVRQLGRLLEGFAIDDEHFLVDAICEMRFQGEYLGHPSTKRHFRQEHLMPDLFPRESYEAWEARGQTEEEMATERVKEVLHAHEPCPLPEDVCRELDRIYSAARREIIG